MSPADSNSMEENEPILATMSGNSHNDGSETVKGYSDSVEVRFSDYCKVFFICQVFKQVWIFIFLFF